MNFSRKTLAVAFLLFSVFAQAQQKPALFALKDVQLLPSVFTQAMQADMDYLLQLNPDRLLAPYLKEAGLQPKAENYGNWENTGLDGHIGGHYLSALSLMYASTADARVKQKLDYFLGELKRAQDASGNGYLCGVPGGKAMWQDIARGKIDASLFSLNKKWVPLYNIHKIYAGLRDAYLLGGSAQAKLMLVKLSDWMLSITAKLSDEQVQQMLVSEHGGLNEVFADVYEITADKKYLNLAQRFSQKSLLDMLSAHQDKLTGMHANTQIPKVIGYQKIASLTGDKSLESAAEFFWDEVVNKRSVSIGGNSVREHFHPINDFHPMIESEQGPETCNTYNMLKLSKDLFLSRADQKYVDYYERALYNHILSSVNPAHPGFVYFTPMRPGHYRVYSQPQTSFWCCVGSGLENHAKYGEFIYAHSGDSLYVNLFIPSKLNWESKEISIVQNTNFPESDKSSIIVNPKKKSRFVLKVRYPNWVTEGQMQVTINGKPVEVGQSRGSYINIDRVWKKGDHVKLHFPMQTTFEQLPDGENYYSILYGPIVLASATSTTDLKGLYADDSRGGHIAAGPKYPLSQIPDINAKVSELPNLVTATDAGALNFRLSKFGNDSTANLIPFYRLHDARYIVYFKVNDPDKAVSADKNLSDSLQQALNQQTIDLVYPGEQQPESDHFVAGEDSQIGVFKDRHWRDARKWFSYQLKNPKNEAAILRITYYGKDQNRNFKILVNGAQVARVTLNGTKGDGFFDEDYQIPAAIINKSGGILKVKFEAEPGSIAGGVFEVRLLRQAK